MKLTKLFFLAILALFSTGAVAQWQAGGGYATLGEDDLDISFGLVYGFVAYEFAASNDLTHVAQIKLGTGVSDDTVIGVTVEVDTFTQLAYRAEYSLNDDFYMFFTPSYANLEVTASSGSVSASEDGWEFGIGAGAGYSFSDSLEGEVGYETFDGTDVINLGLRFSF